MSIKTKNDEAYKLQHHLNLLKEQYVRLQERCVNLEQKLSLASASQLGENEDLFVSRLLKFVASLYDKEEYSDVTVKLCDGEVRAHRFVFAARGESWGVASLAGVNSLDWIEFEEGVGRALLKWVYTGLVDVSDPEFTLKLVRAAARFHLKSLFQRCEEALIGHVNVQNCVKLYTTADEIEASLLKTHCSTLISTHWNDFTPEDFTHMSAPLLYAMFKSKTEFLLHAAVRLQREDVLFLFLIEYDSQLPDILDVCDDQGRLAIDLALEGKQAEIAHTLLTHGASVNALEGDGMTLLHCAVSRGDDFASSFLLESGASVNLREERNGRLPLHIIALSDYDDNCMVESMAQVAKIMLEKGADPNAQDKDMKTCLHYAVETGKTSLFSVLLENSSIKLNLKDCSNFPPLWYALSTSQHFSEDSFAALLIQRGAPLDEETKYYGNTLLHLLAEEGLEEAGLYLLSQGASPSVCNKKGESPLHLTCYRGLPSLTAELLRSGDKSPFSGDIRHEFRESCLHRAVRHGNLLDVVAILDHKALCESGTSSGNFKKPSLELQDSTGLTPLGVAIMNSHLEVAQKLLQSGSNIDAFDLEGNSLLHRALLAKETDLANFLLSQGANPNLRTMTGFSPLQLCIQNCLPEVVESLCKKGAHLGDTSPSFPDPALWLALDAGNEDIAAVLVLHKVNLDSWAEGPEGCAQTLLHRAIDENREDIACFLIRSGCSIEAIRQTGLMNRGAEVAREMYAPLHMCCSWGLLETAKELVSFGAKLNPRDYEGKTPFHLALENNHEELIAFLLEQPTLDLTARDQTGQSPFSLAMAMKNNKAAQAVLRKHPAAAEQYDNKGMNFLHSAIQKGDLEGVLFLLSIHVNLTSRTKDDRAFTPLHLATAQGNEMIVRNLLLAGAGINDLTFQKQTCLHICSLNDQPLLAAVFIQNGIDVDALDDSLNNALHVAVKEGHLAAVRVLLMESRINAGAVNMKGQNALHVLASYPKDNAGALAHLFLEAMPSYPIDNCDVDGNTALLLAYIRGAGQLCRVLVRCGACLGTANKNGVHIFNYEVATKALLKRLLDAVAAEPPWTEGEFCLECGCKFGIATRRHHCRHCGRLLCRKCSEREIPILKFAINKPVRVCDMCFEVLTLGPTNS